MRHVAKGMFLVCLVTVTEFINSIFSVLFSVKKLKSKEEHKLKRKQHKQTFQEKQTINDDVVPQKDNSAVQTQQ